MAHSFDFIFCTTFSMMSETYRTYLMRCAIWYHLSNFKNVNNTHEGVLILVKLQAEVCNFTKVTLFHLCAVVSI